MMRPSAGTLSVMAPLVAGVAEPYAITLSGSEPCTGAWVATSTLPASSGASADEPEEAGSVLVATQAPVHGSLPDSVIAYGSATPATSGAMTLSVPAEGRIMHLEVSAGEAVHAGQT